MSATPLDPRYSPPHPIWWQCTACNACVTNIAPADCPACGKDHREGKGWHHRNAPPSEGAYYRDHADHGFNMYDGQEVRCAACQVPIRNFSHEEAVQANRVREIMRQRLGSRTRSDASPGQDREQVAAAPGINARAELDKLNRVGQAMAPLEIRLAQAGYCEDWCSIFGVMMGSLVRRLGPEQAEGLLLEAVAAINVLHRIRPQPGAPPAKGPTGGNSP